jgi:phosphoribosylaminoimidazole-succinocarboxamide synthase
MESRVVTTVSIPGFVWTSGKVRERAIVDSALGYLIFVTTDRISAFDVVLPTPIPGKGWVLNQLSIFWKKFLEGIVPNDLVSSDEATYLAFLGQLSPELKEALKGRTVLAKSVEVIPVECVVRGYISGSFWGEYQKMRGGKLLPYKVSVHGYELPGDLRESDELLIPIFTPATKSPQGHDINLSYEEMVDHLTIWFIKHPEIQRSTNAELLAQNLCSTSLASYMVAREYAKKRGIIIADTKFEFGIVNGRLTLIDEVLTPDSSRFWDSTTYEPGRTPPSFDKQPVRDWLVKEAQ